MRHLCFVPFRCAPTSYFIRKNTLDACFIGLFHSLRLELESSLSAVIYVKLMQLKWCLRCVQESGISNHPHFPSNSLKVKLFYSNPPILFFHHTSFTPSTPDDRHYIQNDITTLKQNAPVLWKLCSANVAQLIETFLASSKWCEQPSATWANSERGEVLLSHSATAIIPVLIKP